jgi:hypothetical protein
MTDAEQDYKRLNEEQRRRLARIASGLTRAQWQARLPNGWSVAATFAHLGFWDRVSLALVERYAREGVVPVKSDPHLLNAVTATLFEKMSAEQCQAWALESAEAVDARIASLHAGLVAEIMEKDGARRIHRHMHRSGHLDQVEAALGGR